MNMGFQELSLPQLFWHGRTELPLRFPGDWQVKICEMAGDANPPLSTAEIKRNLDNPLDCRHLCLLAEGRKEVAIVIDDLTRPTEASLIVPHILATLHEAGIGHDRIRFLMALGSHGAHTAEDFRKKLGASVVGKYPVYNHNCYENCAEIGKTRSGLRLKINQELMRCDLKIGIGCVMPHLYVGFSGGGKLFLPGMAHIDTIDAFHSFTTPTEKGRLNRENPMIREIDSAVDLIGVDFQVDVLTNTRGQITHLYAGKSSSVYQAASRAAQVAYRTDADSRFDVVISNAHLKANEGDIALVTALDLVRPDGGMCVLIMNSPTGQMTHYLMRWFGKFTGGRQAVKRVALPRDVGIIVFSPFPDPTMFDPYENKESITWQDSWDNVLGNIRAKHPSRPRIAVIPDGTIQYLAHVA